MRVTFWGTRGSLPAAGPETVRYGGNTSCVEVRADDESLLVLDAGTGIRRLGATLGEGLSRIDIFLTHLHMDHLQGLGFFAPLYVHGLNVHIWGPRSTTQDLRGRLTRYLSPPLFPVRLRDLPCRLTLHDVPAGTSRIGRFEVTAALLCHPGPTVGYRITDGAATLAYLPDHEPALGARPFPEAIPGAGRWTSGYALAEGVDLLIHDAQFTPAEYEERVGWGHSAIAHALAFAGMARARRLVVFHHDPGHDDATIDRVVADAVRTTPPSCEVIIGREGLTLTVAL